MENVFHKIDRNMSRIDSKRLKDSTHKWQLRRRLGNTNLLNLIWDKICFQENRSCIVLK